MPGTESSRSRTEARNRGGCGSGRRPANEQESGSYVVVQIADATAEHDLAELLREQVRAKNDFIAGVSHELRTPLTAVVGFAEELRRILVAIPADKYEMIEIVSSQSTTLSHIVEDLLVAARAEMGELTIERLPVDVRSLVERVVRSSRYLQRTQNRRWISTVMT